MLIIKNRIVSLLYRSIGFILLITSLYFYMDEIGSVQEAIIHFDIQSCFLYLFALGIEIIANAIDLRHGIIGIPAGANMKFALPCLTYATSSSILYFALTINEHPSMYTKIGILFHLCLLLISLFDWLLFAEKGTVRWYNAFFSLIYPIYYLIFVLLRTHIWPDIKLYNGADIYPYDFLNPKKTYFPGYICLALIILYSYNLFFLFLNNILSAKYKHLFAKDE
ncbi:MAG TPA: hypothetical protein DEF61_01245 [Firmicutes bacterium]|nr:hypothetical protein [Bacillota bacterium]HBX24902.1 hypothetical protein [Bacillota bacterium]